MAALLGAVLEFPRVRQKKRDPFLALAPPKRAVGIGR